MARTSKRSNRANSRSDSAKEAKQSSFVSPITDQLVKDIGSFSFGNALGSRTYLDTYRKGSPFDLDAIPGVMSIRWVPSIGYANGPTSPVNLAAKALMTRVRAANSGARNYDQTTLMLYVLSVDSAYMYLSWMKRLYGLLALANPVNKYVPQILVEACDGDFNDLILNMSQLRSYLNVFASRLHALPVPSIPLFQRHQAMSENVYADSASPKAQLYAFSPDAYYIYSYNTSVDLGQLTHTPSPAVATNSNISPLTFEEIVNFGEQILTPLLVTYGDEDFAIIAGDILKAYGDEGVSRAAGITEDYAVFPVFDELMLHRIMNATPNGYVSEVVSSDGSVSAIERDYRSGNQDFNVIQNVDDAPVSSYLQSQPDINVIAESLETGSPWGFNIYLRSMVGALDPATAVAALAFSHIPTLTVGTGQSIRLTFENIGTEVVSRLLMYSIDAEDGASQVSDEVFALCYADLSDPDGNGATFGDMLPGLRDHYEVLAHLTQFDYAPMVWPGFRLLDTTAGTIVYSEVEPSMFGDLSDYALISAADIDRIRQVQLLADFGL